MRKPNVLACEALWLMDPADALLVNASGLYRT